MLYHLDKEGIAGIDIDDLADGFLPAAIAESDRWIDERNFDFLHGSTGVVHFLLGFTHIPAVREHLQRFADSLRVTGRQLKQGWSFPIFTGRDYPEPTDGFSMAHGTCALLNVLTRLHGAGIRKETCKELVYGSISLILQSRNTTGPASSLHASLYPEARTGRIAWSRLSWCYGDLSVALSLWQCGCYFGEASWKAAATDIMSYNNRRTLDYSGVKDACICHGTAGAALIYRQFWQETGIGSFYQTSEYWFRQLKDDPSFATHTGRNGLRTATEGGWIYCADLLSGSAGAGLALLSQLIDRPLRWQSCLLIGPVEHF